MRATDPIDQRWADASTPDNALEQRAGSLMRQAGSSEPLSPEQLERVWSKLAPGGALPPRGGLLKRWPLGLALVILGAGLAASLWKFSGTRAALEPAPAPAPVALAPPAAPPLPAPAVAAPSPSPGQPVAPPIPARKPAPALAPAVAAAPAPEAPPATVDEEDRLAAEARLIARAVQQLRQEHDVAASLATLDEHARQFPQGALAREAQITRIEALLASGQRREALAILENAGLEGLPRGEELLLVEAELLSEVGRCPQAVPLFAKTLAASRGDGLEERALYGRAVCGAQLGDAHGSQRDLLDYLEKFPDGRFANAVRGRLGL